MIKEEESRKTVKLGLPKERNMQEIAKYSQ